MAQQRLQTIGLNIRRGDRRDQLAPRVEPSRAAQGVGVQAQGGDARPVQPRLKMARQTGLCQFRLAHDVQDARGNALPQSHHKVIQHGALLVAPDHFAILGGLTQGFARHNVLGRGILTFEGSDACFDKLEPPRAVSHCLAIHPRLHGGPAGQSGRAVHRIPENRVFHMATGPDQPGKDLAAGHPDVGR